MNRKIQFKNAYNGSPIFIDPEHIEAVLDLTDLPRDNGRRQPPFSEIRTTTGHQYYIEGDAMTNLTALEAATMPMTGIVDEEAAETALSGIIEVGKMISVNGKLGAEMPQHAANIFLLALKMAHKAIGSTIGKGEAHVEG